MKLNILHTNDIHSHIENLAYAAGYVNQIRANNPHTLLVDSGDMITGDFQFKFNQGIAEREYNNYMQYDVVTLGNHDFDQGLDFLNDYMAKINAPYVLSNLVDNFKKIGEYQPFIIKEVDGKKIGFISFILPYMKLRLAELLGEEESFDFIDSQSYQQVVDQIRPKVDILISLNHQGFDRDIELAENTTGIDLIIGAHSHTTIEQPIKIKDTYIFQTGSFAKYIGNIELTFEENKITNLNYELKAIDEQLPVDRVLQQILNYHLQVAADNSKVVYGSCSHVLEGEREQMIKNSTSLGTLVCDSYIEFAKERGFNPDFAMINARGLRQSIPTGDITYKTLYNVMPFEKNLLILNISGKDLKASLNNSIELQTSNLKIIKDDERKLIYHQIEGKPIIDDKLYQIATMNYVYEHAMFSQLRNGQLLAQNLGTDIEVVSSYIQKLGHGFSYESNQMVEYREKV